MFDSIAFVPLFCSFALLFLFAYVFAQKQQKNTNYLFLFYSGGFSFVCLTEFLLYFPFSHGLALTLSRISFLLYFFISFAYLPFIYSVAGKKTDRYISVMLIFTIVVSCTSFILPFFRYDAAVDVKNGIVPTNYFLLFSLLTVGIIIRSLQISWRGAHNGSTAAIREQCRLLFWGTIASSSFVTVIVAVLPILIHSYTLYRLSSLSTVINGFFIYWAISRHGLMTVEIARIREVSQVLFRDMSDGVIVSDQIGTVVQVNQAAGTILGVESGVLLSVNQLTEIVAGVNFSECFGPVKAVCVVNEEEKTMLVTHSNISDQNRNLGRITFIRDITEQQKREKTDAWRNQLESLGRLAGGVAHDFNNQLTGILGCADLLLYTVHDNHDVAKLTKTIIAAAERSAQLTRQMLAFSRKGKYQDIPVNINEVVSDVVLMLEHSIDKRIKIRKSMTDLSTVVAGDPNELHNVFLNLAINARDAMPEGGELTFVTGLISRTKEIEELIPAADWVEKYVSVLVRDTGEGIDASIRHKIFEPFFTTKEQGKGCGMGLAAVYGSVQAHIGAITVESESNKGASFTVYLPSVNKTVLPVAEKPLQAENSGKHILIVDDETLVAISTQAILESAGFRTTVCVDGKSAVAEFGRSWESIDLVLLDMMLPDSTGLETFTALKNVDPDLKVLVFSGFSRDNQVQMMLNGGAAGFIKKPFLRNDLLTMVAETIKK